MDGALPGCAFGGCCGGFSIEFRRTMEVELDTFGAWEKKEHLSSKTHECNRGPILWGNKRDGHRVATKRRHASMFKAMVSEHSSDLNCLQNYFVCHFGICAQTQLRAMPIPIYVRFVLSMIYSGRLYIL
jgi:hypothetical protein